MTVIIIKPLHKDDLDAATEIILHAFKNEAFTSSWLDLDDEKTKRAYKVALFAKHI